MRSIPVERAISAFVLVVGGVAFAQPDAVQLEKQAMVRFEKYRTDQRRTGSSDRSQIELALQELSSGATEFERQGRSVDAARSVYEVARCRKLLNDPAAGATYEKARQMARRAGDRDTEAKTLFGLALVAQQATRNLGDAAALIDQGLAIAAALPDKKVHADLLDLRGDLEVKRNDFIAGVRTYDELVRDLQALQDTERLFSAYLGRASALFELGVLCTKTDPTEACVQALVRAKADDERAVGVAYALHWEFLANVARSQASLASLQTANTQIAIEIAKAKQGNETDNIPNVAQQQAAVIAESEKEGKRVRDLRTQASIPSNQDVERTLEQTISRVSSENGDLAASANRPSKTGKSDASSERTPFLNPREPKDVILINVAPPEEQDLNAQLSGLFKSISDHPDPRVRDEFSEAQNAIRARDHKLALTHYLELLNLLDNERNRIGDEQGRGLFMRDKSETYNLLARNLLEEKRYEEAFQLMEKNRGRTLTEMLAARPPELYSPAQRMQLAEMLRVKAELEEYLRANLRAGSGAGSDPEFERRYSAYSEKLQSLRRTAPKIVDLYQPAQISLPKMQALAAEDGSDILQYMVADSGVVIWHVGAKSAKAIRVLLSREHLTQKVNALLEGARGGSGEFDREKASELYLFLISPVLDQITTKHLIIMPGELGLLPFALLQRSADGPALGEEFRISMAPSAGLLMQLSRTDRLGEARIASVINTGLPSARTEAQMLSTMYSRHKILVDPDKADLIGGLGGYDAVNFATHGTFSNQGPMLASLQLRPGASESITAAESFALPLRGTKVVTLGACETGRVGNDAVDEWHGLARAFLFAGAQSLVLASWKVPDESSALYMTTFYREARTQPLSEAARRALIAVKARDPHPRSWAPFIYVGR